MAGDSLVAYYGQRAHEYERIYQKPERQPDLRRLRGWLRDVLTEQRILEIACGTGYWTEAVAPVAAEITASTDAWVTERLWSWSTIGMWRGSTPISRLDAAGNPYQQRRLGDGTTHEVLKNFASRQELEALFAPYASELSIVELTYYWMVRYRVASAGRDEHGHA